MTTPRPAIRAVLWLALGALVGACAPLAAGPTGEAAAPIRDADEPRTSTAPNGTAAPPGVAVPSRGVTGTEAPPVADGASHVFALQDEWAAQRREAERRRAAEAARRRRQTIAVQEVLAAHGYYAGAIDGEAGPATTSAVMAFQKVNGLSRDGVIGPQTLGAVAAPSSPPLVGGAATRIEVDLDRQVVHLVRNGERVRTMNASSGNGEVYRWPDGRLARADTPVGTFRIYRRITGLRDGDLGAMYDPLYFHEGWAIHGSNSVPGYPASHGCVRLSRPDALWLAAQVPNGTQVVVHGRTNAFDPRTESVWLDG